MSLDLEIKLRQPVQVEELLVQTQKNLSFLLKLPILSPVKLVPMKHIIDANHLGTYNVELQSFAKDIVELTFVFVPSTPGYEDPEEEGWWASITVRTALNAPLKMALSAALAISLANMQHSTIKDERIAWVDTSIADANYFLEKLTLARVPNSLEEATKLFSALVSRD